MKLTKISYKTADWELLDLELDQVNLIVGKNGTGKSRTIAVLQLLVKIINQKFDSLSDASWELTFIKSNGDKLVYSFAIAVYSKNDERILTEQLTLNDSTLINRVFGYAVHVYNVQLGEDEELNPPQNKLVLHTNRDVKKYPYIEDLCKWAEESYGCLFANIYSSTKTSQKEYFESNLGDLEIQSLYKGLSESSHLLITDEFNSIGYDISEIYPIDIGSYTVLLVSEKGVERHIPDFRLAQGMLRALFILIYVEYIRTQKAPTMIVIDDFCEGLDYERATKLGKLVYEKCLNSNIQLVATSNDSFLMEVVDIKYWNVLRREGKIVTALNNKNHPELFQDFKFTGLSNFDFFSSDYINKRLAS